MAVPVIAMAQVPPYPCPEMVLSEAIGPALAALRERRKLRQEDLALRLGVQGSSVSRLETPSANPRWDSVARYLDACGATVSELSAAIGEVLGDQSAATGRPRPEWVAAMKHTGIDAPSLGGIAMGVLYYQHPTASADFVASARAAAEEIAAEAVNMAAKARQARELAAGTAKPKDES